MTVGHPASCSWNEPRGSAHELRARGEGVVEMIASWGKSAVNSADVLCERGPRPSDGGVRAGAGVLGSRLAGSRRRGPLPRWGEQATSPALRRDIRYRTHGSHESQSPRALTVNNPFVLATLTTINPSCHPFGLPIRHSPSSGMRFIPLSGADFARQRRSMSRPDHRAGSKQRA